MENTDKLISSLAQTTLPVKQSANPFVLFVCWFAASLIYIAGVLIVMGVRDDIAAKIGSTMFVAELVMLTFVIATTLLSAALLSFPDMFQKRALAFTPIVAFAAFLFVLAVEWHGSIQPELQPVHGVECLLCITLLSLLPGGLLLYILRKQAGVHYYLSGAISLLAASSIGALTLRLSEKTDSISHLLQWHYLPMIGFGALGLIIGRKLLKW
jgi:hypothetical protein